MNFGPRSASRSIKMAALGLSLSLFSTAAIVAMAQQGPKEFHGVLSDATVSEPGAGSTVRFAEVSAVNDARIATSSLVSSTSEKLTVASAPGHHRVPMVTDWSTKHVVFAKPRTEKDAARLENNTRYKMQTYRRNAPMLRKLADSKVDSSDLRDRFRNRVRDPHSLPLKANAAHRDWSVPLGGSVGPTPPQTPTPTVGNNQFPAKFSFDINSTPDCTNDFVVYNTNTKLLVAFNNLYSGTDPVTSDPNGVCAGLSAPTVMWAYNVNSYTDGVTSTSVTLSYDGGQVAFVESSPTQGSVLHILKWSTIDGGTIANPVTASDVTGAPSDWATCGGANHGCIYNIFFSNDNIAGGGTAIAPDSNSAPYYDYETDSLYVGTDKANIHKFTNVFRVFGSVPTPAEAGAPWPIFMNDTANPALTGPIEDAASGRIFVSDVNGDLMFIETGLGPTTPGACRGEGTPVYPCFADGDYNSGAGIGIPDPPVVDSSLGTVIVFAGGNIDTGDAFAAQSQTTIACVCGEGESNVGIHGTGTWEFADFGPVSGGGSGAPMHSGDFDNGYYSNTGTGTVAGYMYVCAIDPNGATTGGNTALRQISFDDNGIVNGVSADFLPVATTPSAECSPVTEVYNPTGGVGGVPADFMFFSVQTNSYACAADPVLGIGGYTSAAPSGGCLMSFNVTGDTTLPAGAFSALVTAGFAAFLPADGGTSGIIVDNVSTDAQASSIYYTPLGYPFFGGFSAGNCTYIGCAVKATQNGLQ